jgi:cytochrome c556
VNWRRFSAACLGLIVCGALAGSSFAAATSEREATMKHVVHALRALNQMWKDNTFDPVAASQRATEIATYLQHFKDLFPAGSEQEDDKAGPRIWTDRAGFERARIDGINAALALAKVTDAAAFQAAMRNLGSTCKACHDKYATLN